MAVPIVYQNFVPPAIDAGNLNTVNNVVYTVIGNGTNAPLSGSDVRTNIGAPAATGGTLTNPTITNPTVTGGTLNGATGNSLTGRLINIQYLTASGTYTPTAGTTSALVEGVGGGAGGGGSLATPPGNTAAGGGGGAGTWGRKFIVSPVVTAVTIGSAGIGVSGAAGTVGTATSFGGFLTLPGGTIGNVGGAVAAVILSSPNGPATTAATGADLSITGAGGAYGIGLTANNAAAGAGASNPLGSGATGIFSNAATVTNGLTSTGFGSGGGGSVAGASSAAGTGGAGRPGILIIYEYS